VEPLVQEWQIFVHVSFVKRFCPSRSTILPATCTCDFVIGKLVCFIVFFLTKIGMFFEVSKQPEKNHCRVFFCDSMDAIQSSGLLYFFDAESF